MGLNLMSKLPKPVTRLMGKIFLKGKQHGPEGCIIAGILVGGTAMVLVGVKTWKNKDILAEDMDNLKTSKALVKADDVEPEVMIVRKQELKRCRMTFARDIAKTYWMPIAFGVGSVTLIWGGRTMLHNELSALGTSYALLLKKYREQQAFLGEGDDEAPFDIPDDGGVKEFIEHKYAVSPYASWWDEGDYDSEQSIWLWRNPFWSNDPLKNAAFLRKCQRDANDQLQAYGYLFLNDVRKMLGLPPTKEGQIVGWTVDGGDRKVEFGIWMSELRKTVCPLNHQFIEGTSPNVLLDFNVEGPILYKLEKTFGVDTARKLVAR